MPLVASVSCRQWQLDRNEQLNTNHGRSFLLHLVKNPGTFPYQFNYFIPMHLH